MISNRLQIDARRKMIEADYAIAGKQALNLVRLILIIFKGSKALLFFLFIFLLGQKIGFKLIDFPNLLLFLLFLRL